MARATVDGAAPPKRAPTRFSWEGRSPWFSFLAETVQGIAFFAIIAGAAVGLNLLVHALVRLSVNLPILYGLQFAEYSLFVVDLLLFARFLSRTLIRGWAEFRP